MYNALLFLHSLLRWLVLLAGFAVVVRSAMGLGGRKRWDVIDNRGIGLFVRSLDVQMLLGLLLYGIFSPFVQLAFSNVAGAMRDPDLRFWLVEHFVGMVVAAGLAHYGQIKLRRTPDAGKHRTAVIFMGISMAAILLSIPWPGMPSARPLFRTF